MAAVERVAGSDPDPGRPVPRPLHLRRGRAAAHAGRLARPTPTRACRPSSQRARARPARGRGAGRLRRAGAATRATGACTPTCRTTSRASCRARGSSASCSRARAVARADVMARFDADGRLRHLGALKLLGDAQTPLAERPIKVADRLAAALLGGRHGRVGAADRGCAWSRCPAHAPGREEAVQMLARAARAPEPPADRARRARRRRAARDRATGARWSPSHVRDLERPRRDGRGDARLARSRAGR